MCRMIFLNLSQLLAVLVISFSIALGTPLKNFELTSRPGVGLVPLERNFESRSLMACAADCFRKRSSCRAILYDERTRRCTPGIGLTYVSGGGIPPRNQLLYSTGAALVCDADAHDVSAAYFIDTGVERSCLLLSLEGATYSEARDACQSRNVELATVKTTEKLKHLQDIMVSYHPSVQPWVGMDDIITEGVYIWSDGSQASSSQMRDLFYDREPDNWRNKEDCIQLSVIGDRRMLKDSTCWTKNPYLCELKV